MSPFLIPFDIFLQRRRRLRRHCDTRAETPCLVTSAFFTRDCLDASATGGAKKRSFQPERLVLRHGVATVSVTSAFFTRDCPDRLLTEKEYFPWQTVYSNVARGLLFSAAAGNSPQRSETPT